jgi:C4-dicarboxylate-specific signal transduction histidine kinase
VNPTTTQPAVAPATPVRGHGIASRNGDELARLRETIADLHVQIAELQQRLQQREEQRRALVHIMSDLHELNSRMSSQRKATLHILGDYESDRRRLGRQTERLDSSRRALLHILQDVHTSNLRLEGSRKAMIHIMDDLRKTTDEMQRREQELREKQEQLVQAGKLATLGELTTGVAHELNNPLNNIGLFIGNAVDLVKLGQPDSDRLLTDLGNALHQVRTATEIISHLRTFGRAAAVSRERVYLNQIVERALSLVQEQLRLRQIMVRLQLQSPEPVVVGNSIQLEQVFLNLLTNARDALVESPVREVTIRSEVRANQVHVTFSDTGPGIARGLEQRIFDPFFTTKEVGQGTGLGLSITYSIIKEHGGTIDVVPGTSGATFAIRLPIGGALPSEPTIL